MTLKPIATIVRANTTASGNACHQAVAKNTSNTYDDTKLARMSAVFAYILKPPRSGRPAARKCAATRRFTSS
jgi:hypothetical protein